jgi:hypothetical protein
MAVTQSPRNCLDLKRKIAELERVRSQMRLEIMRTQTQPGYGTDEDIADTENSLILVEEELGDLVRRYEEGCPS